MSLPWDDFVSVLEQLPQQQLRNVFRVMQQSDVVPLLLKKFDKTTLAELFIYLRGDAKTHGHENILSVMQEMKLPESALSDAPTDVELHAAILISDEDMVKIILKQPRFVHEHTDESIGLFAAVAFHNFDIFKVLLRDPRFDPTAQEGKLLLLAIQENQLKIVDLLLNDPRVDPTVLNNVAMKVAAERNYRDIVERLLIDGRVPATQRAIGRAMHHNFIGVIDTFIAYEPDAVREAIPFAALYDSSLPTLQYVWDKLKMERGSEIADIALFVASREADNPETLEWLLQHAGADPSYNDSAPLREAAKKGHYENASILLSDDRTDPRFEDSAPLRYAIENKDIHMVRLLLENSRAKRRADDFSIMLTAVTTSTPEILQILVRIGDNDLNLERENYRLVNIVIDNDDHDMLKVILAKLIFLDADVIQQFFIRAMINRKPRVLSVIERRAYHSSVQLQVPPDLRRQIMQEVAATNDSSFVRAAFEANVLTPNDTELELITKADPTLRDFWQAQVDGRK